MNQILFNEIENNLNLLLRSSDNQTVAMPKQFMSNQETENSNTGVKLGYSIKRPKQGGLRTYFFENITGIFRFFTLPLEIPN